MTDVDEPEPLDLSEFSALLSPNAERVALHTTQPITVRKPKRSWFRTDGRPEYRAHVHTIRVEHDRDGAFYVVAGALVPELIGLGIREARPCLLVHCITTRGNPFLWPIGLTPPDMTPSGWTTSALECADLAADLWVQVRGDMEVQAYVATEAIGTFPEPEWSEEPFGALVVRAFKNLVIRDLDHQVIRDLRGDN